MLHRTIIFRCWNFNLSQRGRQIKDPFSQIVNMHDSLILLTEAYIKYKWHNIHWKNLFSGYYCFIEKFVNWQFLIICMQNKMFWNLILTHIHMCMLACVRTHSQHSLGDDIDKVKKILHCSLKSCTYRIQLYICLRNFLWLNIV